MNTLRKTFFLTSTIIFSSCSLLGTETETENSVIAFQESGTLVLSQKVSTEELNAEIANNAAPEAMAPVVGYFPDTEKFFPAVNENWISIDKKNNTIALFQGEDKQEEFNANGQLKIDSGNYSIFHKESNPLWYAPDTYFKKRGLEIPSSIDDGRYRRGAYGDLAMFLPNSEAIHSSPIWTEEVGGLRLEEAQLEKLFQALSLGAQVVVK